MNSEQKYKIRRKRCIRFSQERMTYHEANGTVDYRAKDGRATKTFPALDWLALIISHIPRRGEQMVRYYGYYSNAARGKRRKQGLLNAEIPEKGGSRLAPPGVIRPRWQTPIQ